MQRKKVMVFCDYYLPGFKSGGGMWTVVNLVDRFGDRYDFYVVTRNYDGKADKKPYESVSTGEWNTVEQARVFYLDGKMLNVRNFTSLIDEIRPDLVFLNSVFSTPSITFLRARRTAGIARIPVIVSPCGELASAALKLKGAKKKLFLKYAKLRGLHRGVIWRASFESDAQDIKEAIGGEIEIRCAPDLPPKTILPDFDPAEKPAKERDSVRFIFVSRVVRKKNLHYFLECLSSFDKGDITLEIVGPLEDVEYWKECETVARKLPPNVKLNVVGALPYAEILNRMRSAHFFVLPTLNENFGYVFLEALACGCPLLISDRTAWGDISENNSGWTVPLEMPEAWKEVIRQCIAMNGDEYKRMSAAARNFAVNWLANPSVEDATAQLLERAMSN